MRVAVIDGQGGNIGKAIVEKLRKIIPEDVEIIALGTNAIATSSMMRAGANEGATGENAIIYNVKKVDLIMGTISLVVANSMCGELTAHMANAISESPARKMLLPLNRNNIEIAGVDKKEPLPHLLDTMLQSLKEYLNPKKDYLSFTSM